MIPFSGFPGESMQARTGKPVGKKTRRGGKKKPAVSHDTHHQNIGTALKAGDHKAARGHAFALIRSLPVDPIDTPDVTTVTAPTPAAPAVPAGPTGAAKLAGFLKGRSK